MEFIAYIDSPSQCLQLTIKRLIVYSSDWSLSIQFTLNSWLFLKPTTSAWTWFMIWAPHSVMSSGPSLCCHILRKRGQALGSAQDKHSTSFFPWYIFLWGAELQLDIICAWVIFYCLLTHLMHQATNGRERIRGTSQSSIFYSDLLQKFTSQYSG